MHSLSGETGAGTHVAGNVEIVVLSGVDVDRVESVSGAVKQLKRIRVLGSDNLIHNFGGTAEISIQTK